MGDGSPLPGYSSQPQATCAWLGGRAEGEARMMAWAALWFALPARDSCGHRPALAVASNMISADIIIAAEHGSTPARNTWECRAATRPAPHSYHTAMKWLISAEVPPRTGASSRNNFCRRFDDRRPQLPALRPSSVTQWRNLHLPSSKLDPQVQAANRRRFHAPAKTVRKEAKDRREQAHKGAPNLCSRRRRHSSFSAITLRAVGTPTKLGLCPV